MKDISILKTVRTVNILCAVVFSALSLWLLAIDGGLYLEKIESLSIFLPTKAFMGELLQTPGGLLQAAALFLTQTFHLPWLGALLYTALLLCIPAVAVKAFRLKWTAFPALLLVPAMMLLALLNMEYLIFSMKTPGYAFLLPLGTFLGVLLFWGYRLIRPWYARCIAITLTAWFGYCALGFYGLFATALMLSCELSCLLQKDGDYARWKPAAGIIIALFGIFLVPKIWFAQIGGRLLLDRLYTIQLPRFYEGEESHLIPYYIIMLLLLLLPLLSLARGWKNTGQETAKAGQKTAKTGQKAAKAGQKTQKMQQIVVLLIAVAAMASIFKFRYTDANFRMTLALDRALQNCEWKKAAQLAETLKDEPTRINVFLTDIALMRSGEAGEKLFKYKISSADPNTERALRATHDAASMMLSYHVGMINYAYRWAMENKVEYGLTVEYLKYMVKCALIKGEYALAEKYLDNLSLTAFHKDWAEKYREYVKNPKKMTADPEFAQILPIVTPDNYFITDHGQLEGYIWPRLASLIPRNPQQTELAMISALICRDLQGFANKVPQYMETHKGRIPTHYQEAIIMWLITHGIHDYKKFSIEDEVINRAHQFLQMTKQYSDQSEEMLKEIAEPQFGDTYFYYYELNKGFKII